MSRMAEYYDFLTMLYRLSTDALEIMLEYENDGYKRKLIEGEIEGRNKCKR